MQKSGAMIDPSAGVHIHVGYNNFNDEQTKNLMINTALMMPVLRGMVSEAWKGRSYAMMPPSSRTDSESGTSDRNGFKTSLKRIAETTNASRAVSAYSQNIQSGRSSLLNLTNFGSSSKPTFEYRLQGSTVESDTMINTVKLLQQIWKASLQGVIPIEEGVGKRQDKVLVDLLGLDLYTFCRNRFMETELPRIAGDDDAPGMTSENRRRLTKDKKGYNFPVSASSINS